MANQGIKCECGKINREGLKFCTECGRALNPDKITLLNNINHDVKNSEGRVCPNCNNDVRDGLKFCTKCGWSLGQAEEIVPEKNEPEISVVAEEKEPEVSVPEISIVVEKEPEVSVPEVSIVVEKEPEVNVPEISVTDEDLASSNTDMQTKDVVVNQTEASVLSNVVICPGCGAENNAGVNYCRKCGAKLSENISNNQSTKKRKKGKAVVWVIGIIMALVLVMAIVVGYLWYSNNTWLMNLLSQTGIVNVTNESDDDTSLTETDTTENKETTNVDATEENQIKDVDVFAGIDVQFTGTDGKGIAELIDNNNYKGIKYILSNEDGLSNGDEIEISLEYTISKEDFTQKNQIKPTSESKKYTVAGLEEIVIKENTLSKDTLEDIFEKYNAHYNNNYNSSNSYMVLEFLNDDDIPELLVQYDGTIDVFEYVNGDVCAIAAFREEDNAFLYSPTDEKFILSGFINYGWMYAYSLNPQNPGFIEGAHTGDGGSYYSVDSERNKIGTMSADDFAAFRERYRDDNYLIYNMKKSKEFQDAEEAYNYLVGVNESRNAYTLKGVDVAKLPLLGVEASSVLEASSKDHMTYNPENMCDGNVKTTWCEGEEGLGQDVSFKVKLDGYHQISAIKIYNGFLKTKRRYAINGKVTNIQIDYENDLNQEAGLVVMNCNEEDVTFANDELNPTVIIAPENCITDEITITILDAISGSEYEDVGISEIEVFGR